MDLFESLGFKYSGSKTQSVICNIALEQYPDFILTKEDIERFPTSYSTLN